MVWPLERNESAATPGDLLSLEKGNCGKKWFITSQPSEKSKLTQWNSSGAYKERDLHKLFEEFLKVRPVKVRVQT